MKKIIIIFLMIIMCLFLAGCHEDVTYHEASGSMSIAFNERG